MNYEDIPKEELMLVSEKMIGIVLLNAERDSDGEPIQAYNYYDFDGRKPL